MKLHRKVRVNQTKLDLKVGDNISYQLNLDRVTTAFVVKKVTNITPRLGIIRVACYNKGCRNKNCTYLDLYDNEISTIKKTRKTPGRVLLSML